MKKKPPRALFKPPAPVSDEDAQLFRAAVDQVAPLKTPPRAIHAKSKPRPKPLEREDEAGVLDSWHTGSPANSPQNAGLSDHLPQSLATEAGVTNSYTRNGISRDTLRKLRRGHWRVQDELDLHGLIVEEARGLLAAFLRESLNAGLRSVRVIHGKGLRSKNQAPILKMRVAGWLAQHDGVLAYCEARPADGGSGATVVLLRVKSVT